jgi:hypothetical protein
MSTCTVTERQRATEVAERHPGWQVWTSRPYATRAAGNHHDYYDGYEESVFSDSYAELDAKLTGQDDNDEAHKP